MRKIINPKIEFQKNRELINYLSEIVEDDKFQECVNVALLEFINNLPEEPIQSALMLKGAKKFIYILKSLVSINSEVKKDNVNLKFE